MIFVALWLLLTNRKVRKNDWTFRCNGRYAHASPLVNLHKTFNGEFTGQFITLGCSICKHVDLVFMWSPSGSSITDADSHTRTLMCFNVAIKAKAEHLQLNAFISLYVCHCFLTQKLRWETCLQKRVQFPKLKFS